ncbi:hypothetical protein B0H11DRAFT_1930880 [Mycena galericulata]|nr:hypothetical protein B0H11DRAFT_1930880 [Mycena galericulata]
MGSQGAQIVTPIGSLTGPSAPKAASFRVPYSWDENAPKLETDSHEELLSFVDQVEEIFSCANMTDDVKKKEYITSLLPFRRRKMWQALDSYYSGSFADYLGEIYKSYPEVHVERLGTLERLREICQSYDGIRAVQEGRLRRFGVEFKAEFRKLSMAPALITNSNAVERYLGTLEPNFAMAIRSVVRSSLLLKDEFGVASKPTLVAAQQAPIIRKNDQIQLSDLMNIAETMAKTNVEYFPSPASIRDANSVVQSGLKAENRSQKMKELVQDVSESRQALDSGRKRDRKRFGEGKRPSEPRVPGLIPTHNVFEAGVEGDGGSIHSLPLPFKRDQSSENQDWRLVDCSDEDEPEVDWLEMAQDEIRTLKVRLARLQNENSAQSSVNYPFLAQPATNSSFLNDNGDYTRGYSGTPSRSL